MPTPQAVLEWPSEAPETTVWPEVETEVPSWAAPREKILATVCIERQPAFSGKLKAEIERAERIATLKDDWDGDGSVGYSKSTLDRAIKFMTTHVRDLWEFYGVESPIPQIGPGPDGSIDIHWKQRTWELLVNIPPDPAAMAVFYGDNYGAQKIRGCVDPDKFNLGIAAWLTH